MTTTRFQIIADQLADDECGFDFCELDREAAIKFTDQLAASMGRTYKLIECYIDEEARATAAELSEIRGCPVEISKSRTIHTSHPI